MADKATTEAVERFVIELVNCDEAFTAADVTLGARAAGIQVHYSDSRNILHDLHRRGILGTSYQRSSVQLTDGTKPFVYHPVGFTANHYRSNQSSLMASDHPDQVSQPKPGLLARLKQFLLGRGDSDRSDSSKDARSLANQAPATQATRAAQRKNVTLNLNAPSLLPISRKELLAGAKSINLWSSPWFGRRDVIPPIDDPRTLLIDRAMITAGLITPEELARIHEVGAQMDRYRPDELLMRHQANRAGRDAVAEDRRAKAERKAAKKAESEAKRQRRREEIEIRRATRIDFLGRRVSTKLHLCESDEERLNAAGLPILHTTTELADAMGIQLSQLRWLAFHDDVASSTHYVEFDIPKRAGGVRRLSAPLPRLAEAQRWIYSQILRGMPVDDCVHGFVPGRGTATGAAPHVGQDVILNMDLEDFFPSIGFARIRHTFERLGYSPAVSTVLGLICTEAPRRKVSFQGATYYVATGQRVLPQGACTSPALSNLVAGKLDRRILGFAKCIGATYTRYADDLTLSGGQDLANRIGYTIAKIRHISEDEGFRVKPSKTRVLRQNTAQKVTSLVVNSKPGVGRKKLRQLRAILHNASQTGLQAQNRNSHPNFRASLEGMIAYIGMTHPEKASELKAKLKTIGD
ncbi:reverse transcriptase family protein [Rhodopirellula sp. MGV]|uniref:reverse transcriptase family protein n=1 Tax=Rhodopirellula sp. MGV TaxID=2023130 RepID=UPI00117B2630|nr:reverse transcriptase family protein [Rhodopirellula sp. MGV]